MNKSDLPNIKTGSKRPKRYSYFHAPHKNKSIIHTYLILHYLYYTKYLNCYDISARHIKSSTIGSNEKER